MSRVPEIAPETFSPAQREIYDRMMASRPDGKLMGPSSLWIRDANLAAATGQMAKVLRQDGNLDAPLFEMITLIVARQWTAHYVWAVHVKEAARVGLEPAVVEAIRARRAPPFANEKQAAIYDMVHELVETKQLANATYARALALFGVDLILEIVTAVGFYTLVSMTLKTFDAPAPDDARPLD